MSPQLNFIPVLLLLAVAGVIEAGQSANSQAALDDFSKTQPSSLLTAPAELISASSENVRFSRLLKDNSNRLQFTSIGNDSPQIYGLNKESKSGKSKGKLISASTFGRRALDYDESHAIEEPTSETKHIPNPYPVGNEYVYVRASKEQIDSAVAASVTSINNKPPRVPLALLRHKKGNRVNISPLFTELPPVQDVEVAGAKEFVWVDKPAEQFVGVNRQGRKHQEVDDTTTNPIYQDEDVEATTLPVETLLETTTSKLNKSKMVVNIVTSEPRISVESSVSSGEKRDRKGRLRSKSTSTTSTSSTSTSTTSTTTESASEATSSSTTVSSTTSEAPTTVAPPVLSSSSPKDDKENLVADAFHRGASSFHGFEDSQAKLQTAESSQPARVNVRPAQNGKEYEYEYIYYYYDDDDDNNSTEKQHSGKAGHNKQVVKQSSTSTSTTLNPAAGASAAPASSSTTTLTSTTTSTTSAPQIADADFEYEDDGVGEEDEVQVQQTPELQKTPPAVTRTSDAPVHKGISSAEKLSNTNPINQLDRSRGPKILSSEKFDDTAADYKLETEASQEDEEIAAPLAPVRSRGQPQRQPPVSSEDDEQTADVPNVSREPSTSSPAATIPGFDFAHMPTLAKAHKDSVNVPIVLKQSSLLKAVPVSQLQSQNSEHSEEQLSTVPITTPSTTTSTTEAASSVRPSPPRLRGQRPRVTPRPATSTSAVAPEQQEEEKPQQPSRRPFRDPNSRRAPIRKPVQEATASASEQEPAASPIIENHARPLPIRPRFPPRTGGQATTTTASPSDETVSDAPIAPVTVSAAELNSFEDKKSKDSHVRVKSANDLYAFTRLQQAISSRAPSRIPPKLVAGFVNSAEATTDAMTSSEVTTVSSFGGQSSETIVSDESPSTPSTTTTTTTQAVQLDKFGRQRTRFGARPRKPLSGGASASSTTTEAPSGTTARGRFSGRRRTSTTETSESAAPQQESSAPSTDSEAPKPRIPARNRFSSRNRGASSTEASTTSVEGQKSVEAEKPSSPVTTQAPRRRPGAFGGRRRPNQIPSQPEASSVQEETSSSAPSEASPLAPSSTAAPATPSGGRTRFNFGAGGRTRPVAASVATPVVNAVRIRGGGRLRGQTSSTTTEAAPEEIQSEGTLLEQPADAEQSPTIQNENLEPAVQSTIPPDTVAPPRGSGGVLGRLKNRPKLVVTTPPPAPEASLADRKASRLNGILNRRKNLGQLAAAVHVKEEVKETTYEGAEEASNHAQEQTDDDHKGVVVQISSSITESEEVNEGQAGEVLEPSTTPAGSILNRLKSQRKPGSLFRKKPDPHGE